MESRAKRFSQAIATLEKYFEKKLDERVKLLYLNQLADLAIEQIEAAVAAAVATLRFFPKIVELRELAEGTAEDRALSAWNLLELARAEVGYWPSIYIADKLVAQALVETFGGWLSYCEQMHMVFSDETGRLIAGLSPEMQRAKQKEFIAHYRRAQFAPHRVALYQIGKCESENRATISSWKRGIFPDGKFSQAIGLIADGKIKIVPVEYDATTGALCEREQCLIQSGNVQGLLALGIGPPKMLPEKPEEAKPKLALVSGSSERIDLGEAAHALKQMPRAGLTDEQIAARREILREQARLITE